MNYLEFCKAIGSDRVSSLAEELYNKAQSEGELTKPVKIELIPKYFLNTKEDVIWAAKEIEKDQLSLTYMNFLRVAYPVLKGFDIPFLTPEEGNVMKNFGPLLSLMDLTISMEEEIKNRKIDDVTADRVRGALERALLSYKNVYGFYAMKENIYFWDRHYLIPDLFPIETLEFEKTQLPDEGTYFKNKATGEITVLIDITENDKAYCGYTVKDGGDADKYVELLKDEYDCSLAPGDWIISIHIPGGTKLDSETCQNTYSKGIEFIRKTYPEIDFKAMYVRSWLMCPELGEFLSENSKILSFQSFYKRFPVKSDGKEVFGFVFPKPIEKYEDMPENTTLERGLKKRYLDNRPIYVYAGIHLFEEDK